MNPKVDLNSIQDDSDDWPVPTHNPAGKFVPYYGQGLILFLKFKF